MANDIVIDCITQSQVLDVEGFRAQYGDSGLHPDSELFGAGFRLLLGQNPYARPDDPVAFLGRVDGRVVSQIITMPDLLCCGEASIRWFWGQSFVTYPEARGKGVGTVLVDRMNQELKARGICYGAYAMSPMSRRVWEKCGMRYLGRINRYALLLDTRPLLAFMRMPPFALPWLRAAGNLGVRLGYGTAQALTGGAAAGYCLHEVSEFDDRLTHFLAGLSLPRQPNPRQRTTAANCAAVAVSFAPAFHRDVAGLNWRLRNTQAGSPRRHYYAAYVVDPQGNIAGYFVLKLGTYQKFGGKVIPGLRLASLLDYRASDRKALRILLILALRQARQLGGELFELINSHSWVAEAARRLGMIKLGGYEMAADSPPGCPLLDLPKAQWWIATGESDAFFF